MPNTSAHTIHLGEAYGIRKKPDAFLDVPDYCNVLGMSISDYQARFPEAWYYLSVDLGWSDAEILQRTYFCSAFLDAALQGYEQGAGNPFYRRNIIVPAGKWFYNMELRWPQGMVTGEGAYNISWLQLDSTNWKSVYGAQQNGTMLGLCPITYAGEGELSAYPVSLGSGGEYCHSSQAKHLCFGGESGALFNNNAIRTAGVMYHTAGENSGAFDCLFIEHNDFGLMINGNPAYVQATGNSFFRNAVAGIGIRGCARGVMDMSFSGDFNPWSIFMFRQNTTLLSPNGVAYWPYASQGNPGGNIQLQFVKTESFACRSGFQGYSTCYPDIPGKGQMLARLTGRFKFGVQGGQSFVHSGRVNTLIQVADDYYQGGQLPFQIPLGNSSIDVRNYATVNFAYWLHDVNQNKKWVADSTGIDADQHGSGFTWRNDANSNRCFDVSNPSTVLNSITAAYQGRQPFSNLTAPLAPGGINPWNETAGPGGLGSPSGYNEVTGVAYPI